MTTPARRTIVKVCGLTRLEDARFAVSCGADWLGFVMMGETPRWIAPADAAAIALALPGVTTVAVMVSPTPEDALEVARASRAARVQLHRVDPAQWPASFPLPAAFAIPVAPDGTLQHALPAERHLVMLDTAHPLKAGGTGEVFPWDAAAALAARRPVLLAGGLDGDNVAAAITRVRPFGVDASSRLESAPGVKDPAKVRRFVAAVREIDERTHAGA